MFVLKCPKCTKILPAKQLFFGSAPSQRIFCSRCGYKIVHGKHPILWFVYFMGTYITSYIIFPYVIHSSFPKLNGFMVFCSCFMLFAFIFIIFRPIYFCALIFMEQNRRNLE